MDSALDPTLAAHARTQHGMLTTAQAHTLGTSSLVLVRLVRDGVLLHPCRGLYAVTDQVDQGAEAWHRHLSAGAHLLYDDASLTSASAALAHGLPVWGVDLARPDLHRPVDRSVGVKAFRVRPRPRTLGRPEPVLVDLGRTDEMATAVVQLALDHGPVAGTVSADDALRRGLVSLGQLETAAGLVATWPGSCRVRSMLAFVDGRSESVGETRCRIELVSHGIRVQPQAVIRERDGSVVARVDLLVEGQAVVVEFDGKVKYAAGEPQVLWDEKRREDRLRALGYAVVRITWADLERPGAAVAKVRRALTVPA
ncbi:MAG: type IV toxin-antitoxin system AbiEi family antitoxin domain-containing protein [Ornithinibacter sp.]